MLFAKKNSVRVSPSQEIKEALCPFCDEPVSARLGEIRVWHFAHRSGSLCEATRYPMTAWHYLWQRRFPAGTQEVRVDYKGMFRIADVKVGNLVYEFQRRMMPVSEMLERDYFYRAVGLELRWVFDLTDYQESPIEEPKNRFDIYKKENFHTFIWRWAPEWIGKLKMPVYVDLGDSICKIMKIHTDSRPFRGWGREGFWRQLQGVSPQSRELVRPMEGGICTHCFFGVDVCAGHGYARVP